MSKKTEKVKLSKDGSSIDFVASDNLPTSTKKFRQSPEIEGFYRFIYENDLRQEAVGVLDVILGRRREERDVAAAAAKIAFCVLRFGVYSAVGVARDLSSGPMSNVGRTR
jgi:hypothetical protein